jgi:phosphonatase-like hydrolase
MHFQLAVFDMAGTTVVDHGVVNCAFQQAFLSEQIEVPSAEIDRIMGYHKAEAIRLMLDKYASVSPENTDQLINTLLNRFTEQLINIYHTEPLEAQPSAEELFASLRSKGIKVALNTGFTRIITDVILQRLQWTSEVVDAVICSDEVERGRPHADMIKALMKTFHIKDASGVIKCGDTSVDIEEGRNANCGLVIGITTGAFTRAALLEYKPDVIIDSLAEFSALLAKEHA